MFQLLKMVQIWRKLFRAWEVCCVSLRWKASCVSLIWILHSVSYINCYLSSYLQQLSNEQVQNDNRDVLWFNYYGLNQLANSLEASRPTPKNGQHNYDGNNFSHYNAPLEATNAYSHTDASLPSSVEQRGFGIHSNEQNLFANLLSHGLSSNLKYSNPNAYSNEVPYYSSNSPMEEIHHAQHYDNVQDYLPFTDLNEGFLQQQGFTGLNHNVPTHDTNNNIGSLPLVYESVPLYSDENQNSHTGYIDFSLESLTRSEEDSLSLEQAHNEYPPVEPVGSSEYDEGISHYPGGNYVSRQDQAANFQPLDSRNIDNFMVNNNIPSHNQYPHHNRQQELFQHVFSDPYNEYNVNNQHVGAKNYASGTTHYSNNGLSHTHGIPHQNTGQYAPNPHIPSPLYQTPQTNNLIHLLNQRLSGLANPRPNPNYPNRSQITNNQHSLVHNLLPALNSRNLVTRQAVPFQLPNIMNALHKIQALETQKSSPMHTAQNILSPTIQMATPSPPNTDIVRDLLSSLYGEKKTQSGPIFHQPARLHHSPFYFPHPAPPSIAFGGISPLKHLPLHAVPFAKTTHQRPAPLARRSLPRSVPRRRNRGTRSKEGRGGRRKGKRYLGNKKKSPIQTVEFEMTEDDDDYVLFSDNYEEHYDFENDEDQAEYSNEYY